MDDSSIDCEPESVPDTHLSRALKTPSKNIDWSLTYSSDEESQKQVRRNRSLSEPALDVTEMRRRPRSSTVDSRLSPALVQATIGEDTHNNRPRFSPIMCLATLFLISCYTTFFLPYPDIPPVPVMAASHAFVTEAALLPPAREPRSVADGWMHARADHLREPLIYKREEDPLVKYYQQEAFHTRSYAKEINIGILAVISLWAVWEHRRRKSGNA